MKNLFTTKNNNVYKKILNEYINSQILETLNSNKSHCKILNDKIFKILNIKKDKNSNFKILQELINELRNEKKYYINLTSKSVNIFLNKKIYVLFNVIHYIIFIILTTIVIEFLMISFMGFILSTDETILLILDLFILGYVCYWVFIYKD